MNLTVEKKDKFDQIEELIHFLRTPLASIKIGAEILKDMLPTIFAGFNLAVQGKLVADQTTIIDLDKLSTVLENILHESNKISKYLNSSLNNKEISLEKRL